MSVIDTSPTADVKTFDADTAIKLRHEAIGIVNQLPPNEDEALAVLAYARQFLLKFVLGKSV